MAHQLHYTSAATGLSGRPGFQFVAASPGATAAMQQAVAPYLSYRPPPSAPSQPSTAELSRFPVSYCFVPDGDTAILAQCRYLGTDYSGRYGNYLGHAVVAELTELGEHPPIALWRSPLWASEPAATEALPELAELPVGEAADPDAVAGRLAGHWGMLAQLLEAALATLDGRAGQVVLVADQAETVAWWIAAVSHSLPRPWARRLSFVTYTSDAGRARQHLVGTTTDAWRGAAGHGQVFRLDAPGQAAPTTAGRYATALAGAWRSGDRYQLDVLNDLVSTLGADRDAVAALAMLCRGDPLAAESGQEVASLVTGHADRLPPWVWDDLASLFPPASPRFTDEVGLELALAVHRAARHTGRSGLADGAGAVAVRLAIGARADRPKLAEVELSAGAAAALAPAVAAVLRCPADLDDLAGLVRQARRLRIPVDADGLCEGTARAVRATPTTPAASATADPAARADPVARRGRSKRGESPPRSGTGGVPGGGAEELLRTVAEPVAQAAVLTGLVDGLADASDELRGRLLTDQVCDLLGRRDWDAAPRVGAHVLASRGRRYPAEREPVTAALADLADRGLLADHELGRKLREVWHSESGQAGEPSLALCLRLLARVEAAQPARERGVLALARRAFAAGDLASRDALGLAEALHRLLGRERQEPVVADAIAVRAIHRARTDATAALLALSGVEQLAHPAIYQQAVAAVAAAGPAGFAAAPVQAQADVLLRLPPDSDLRRTLVRSLLEQVDQGVRGAGLNLGHLAVLLWREQRPDPAITRAVAKLARHPKYGRNLRAGLQRRHPPLVEELAVMLQEDNRSLWSRIIGR